MIPAVASDGNLSNDNRSGVTVSHHVSIILPFLTIQGTESRETEYHSSTEGHVHSSNSEFHSLASEPYSGRLSELQPRMKM